MVTSKAGKRNETGFISAFKQCDLDYIRACVRNKHSNQIEKMYKACLFPPYDILKEFMNLVKATENKTTITLLDLMEKYNGFN